jgi:predicted transposase/invertase (TIGR01784 family)
MKTDKLFYQIFINQQSLIHELLPDIPSDCQFEYTAPVVKETEFRLDGVFTPLSDDPNVPLIFLEAQMQKDVKFYRRYFGEIFLYLSQYEETRTWKGLLIFKNKNHDLGSEIPYKILLDNNITRLYLEDLLTTENLSPNLALLKLIVVKNSEITNLGKLVLNSAKTEDEFQRQFTLIEAILKSKLPQLSTEEILMMFDLKTATMPKLDAYETLVKYWQDKAKEEGLQKGLQEGRQEGLQEGRQEGEADLLIRILTRRFGNLTDNQKEKVRSLSIPELESLGEALFDFQSISDLEKWFES